MKKPLKNRQLKVVVFTAAFLVLAATGPFVPFTVSPAKAENAAGENLGKEASQIWTKLIRELEGRREEGPLTVDDLFTLAVSYANAGRLKEATETFREIERHEPSLEERHRRVASYAIRYQQNPYDVVGLARLAFAYYAIEEYQSSVEFFQRLVTLDPGNEWVRNYLAVSLYKCNQLDKAIAVLEENLLLNPANPYTHALLGMAYYEKGWYLRALQELSKGRQAIQNLLTF